MRISFFILLCFVWSFNTLQSQEAKYHHEVEKYITQIERHKANNNLSEEAKYQNKLAFLYWSAGDMHAAADCFKRSIQLNQQLDNKRALQTLYNHLGTIYFELSDFEKAITNYEKGLNLSVISGKTDDIISGNMNLANCLQELGHYSESSKRSKAALGKALEKKDMELVVECYNLLAENANKLGNSKEAKEYYDKYNTISVHLQKQKMEKLETQTKQFEQEVISKNIELKNTRDTLGTVQKEKKEIQLQNEILNKENKIKELMLAEEQARAEAEKREQFLIISVLGVFLIGLCVIVILVMRQMNQKKRANNLLKETNKKIEQQKVEIGHQRDVAKVQAKRITDSIQYAQRIQRAVIPPESLLTECFDEFFIYYKPRDIVSGDFYWFSKKDHLLIVAAADCTGHGVPGAFMSMLGIAFLNEIVNKMAVNKHINSLTSHNILNELRKTVISSLHQTGNANEPKDGMDISLCVFNLEEDTVQYSGANNPLLIIRNGELIKYKADKMPVSYHQKLKVPFTSTTISLEKNDCIYMFSDGYIDQFGGMRGNKFLIKRFRELLLKNFGSSMQKQKEALVENMDDWMHNTTQLDDMLVIGLRYNPDKYKSDLGRNWKDKTILIAEDKDVNYFLLAEVLKDTKAKLVRVKDGAEAVEHIKNNLVDLVLMDINMPNMSGFEATRLIKEFKQDISIVIQTAMHDGNEREESKKAGADDFISKPIDLKSFMNIIEKYLN